MNTQAIKNACLAAGSQTALASRINVSAGLVWQWVNGYLSVDPKHYPAIERVTQNAVTVADLLADYYANKAEAA